MKKVNILGSIFAVFFLCFVVGCSEGPAEKKGRQLDEAVEDVSDKLQDKGPMEKAGEKVDEATGN